MQVSKPVVKAITQIEKYLNSLIKNDPTLINQLLRAYLSSYTNNPVNIGVLAQSSEGKTYATVQISNIFPKEDIVLIGRMSPTALIHQHGVLIDENNEPIEPMIEGLDRDLESVKKGEFGDKDDIYTINETKKELKSKARTLVDLKNKILIFLDNPNQNTYEMLKPIMSHDKNEIIYKTTKGDGSLNVKETIIRNWPVFIFCSAKNEAKNEVWQEIETRVFMTSPNTDTAKYAQANKLTAQRFGLPGFASGIYDNKEDKKEAVILIQNLKKTFLELCDNNNNPIYNPFAERIAELFPSNQGISMRHFSRLMSFCNIETLINSEFNVKWDFRTNEGVKRPCVITTLADIDKAVKVLGKISTVPPNQIKFYEKIFLPLTNEKLDSKEQGLTSKDLAEKYTEVFKKPITNKQVLENYLSPLVSHGLLEFDSVQGDKYNHYTSTGKITINNLNELSHSILKESNEIERSKVSFVYILARLEEIKSHSIKNGISKGFFVSPGIYLSDSQIQSNIFADF